MSGRQPASTGFSRRELLVAGAAAGAALAVGETAIQAAPDGDWRTVVRSDFRSSGDGPGWGAPWRCTGVANLRRSDGSGILEAGSDVFPNDRRPVAFAVDARARDLRVAATIRAPGEAPGVVVRRRSPRAYYAAIYDSERLALRILRRDAGELVELAVAIVPIAVPPVILSLECIGAHPTVLRAELLDAAGIRSSAGATDASPALQGAGDAGVFATANTLFPSDPAPGLPALGNVHLLPWSVEEGQAVMATPVGAAIVGEITRRSSAHFEEISVTTPEQARRSRPTVIAATTGPPVAGGARLQLASDLPASVEIELSYSKRFQRSWTVSAGRTGAFDAAAKTIQGLEEGRRVWWRARLRRRGKASVGPTRSFRVLPGPASAAAAAIAVGSCASQFGPIFERLAAQRPDVFVWQGDLNYPDTHGPLAQTIDGYAGIWRDFLANPALAPILERTAFAPQRDDHDYGVQDANASLIGAYPWALGPWNALVNRRTHYRFRAGATEFWVLDQRRFKTGPGTPDPAAQTLLGAAQRRWLFKTLAESDARFKIICSPTTLFMAANARDGNWSAGFEAERDLLLAHLHRRVTGKAVFLTGDVHLTGVHDDGQWLEVRAAPLGIPVPNDVTLVDPLAATALRARPAVNYADERCHLTMVRPHGNGSRATLELELLREDGATPWRRTLSAGSG